MSSLSDARQSKPQISTARLTPGISAPLTAAQERVWMSYRMGQTGPEFSYPLGFDLRGELDVEALESAIDALVARHEALRTTATEVDGTPVQHVHPPTDGWLERAAYSDGAVAAAVEEPFDLETGPVFRARLFDLAEREFLLVLALHHIAIDGWSDDILTRDLGALYARSAGFAHPELEPVTMQPREAALEAQRVADPVRRAESLAFWQAQLAGAPESLELPLDEARPVEPSFAGDRVTRKLSPRCCADIDRFGNRVLDRHVVLFAAYSVFLTRWVEEDEVVVGFPVSGRSFPELANSVGFFANLLPIRVSVDENATFASLVAHVRTTIEAAQDHPDTSFAQIVEQLTPARAVGRMPLLQTAFGWEEHPALDLPGLLVEPIDLRPHTTRYDAAADFLTTDSGLIEIELSYASDLLSRGTAEYAADQLAVCIAHAVAEPDRPLGELLLITADETGRLARSEVGERPPAHAADVVERFDAIAGVRARHPAVIAEGCALTFRDVKDRTDHVAYSLAELGVGRESVVGVSATRRADLVVHILGILKAGAAYLPLDPTLPSARLQHMLSETGASLVLAPPDELSTFEDLLRDTPVRCLAVADSEGIGANRGVEPAHVPVSADNSAYVIYTSGTTGRPKGVSVMRGAVANLLEALERTGIASGPPRVVAWNAAATFDASVQQWVRLARGDTLVVIGDADRADPAALMALVATAGVDDLDLTPSFAETVMASLDLESALAGRSSPLRMLVGGEPIPPPLWSRLRMLTDAGVIEAFNLYGPTECTVDVTCSRLADKDAPNAGGPLARTRTYVLDRFGRRVAPGFPGDLWVAGAGLARGYVADPALTSRRFAPDIYGEPGARMYRTGDRARWVDGKLELLGRDDDQVKVRGFRVELGEVEQALQLHPGVSRAVVAKLDDGAGGGSLAAYYVAAAPLDSEEMSRQLETQLPAYMLPPTFTRIDRIPLTRSGKLDRGALPEPSTTRSSATVEAADQSSPSGPLEELIAGVWGEVLGVERIEATDNFFSLGGHSLLAIKVVARLKKRLSLSIPMTAVFENPSVRELAHFAEGEMLAQLASRDSGSDEHRNARAT